MKMNVYITNPEAFLREPDIYGMFVLEHTRLMDGVWVFVCEVEIDTSEVDSNELIKLATAELDNDIAKHTTMLQNLEQRKAELIALPAPEKENDLY